MFITCANDSNIYYYIHGYITYQGDIDRNSAITKSLYVCMHIYMGMCVICDIRVWMYVDYKAYVSFYVCIYMGVDKHMTISIYFYKTVDMHFY